MAPSLDQMQTVKRSWLEPMQSGSAKAASAIDAGPCGYIAVTGAKNVEKASNPRNLINYGTVTRALTSSTG